MLQTSEQIRDPSFPVRGVVSYWRLPSVEDRFYMSA